MPNWTKDDLRAYELRRAVGNPIQSPEPKRDPIRSNHPKQNRREEKSAGRSRVIIESHRARLCDADNLYVKALLDAIRYAGLIADDSPAHIELIVRQSKVKQAQEKTVVTIERI